MARRQRGEREVIFSVTIAPHFPPYKKVWMLAKVLKEKNHKVVANTSKSRRCEKGDLKREAGAARVGQAVMKRWGEDGGELRGAGESDEVVTGEAWCK